MKFTPTEIQDVILIEPEVFEDDRGYFFEVYHWEKFRKAGIHSAFIQHNQSKSVQGTLRGMHYQETPHEQGKLVRVLSGEIFDVAVDIRPDSPDFKKWVARKLSAGRKDMLYIPPGFAHGFYTLSETAEIEYKCTDLYAPQYEQTIRWDDPQFGIEWPLIPNVELKMSEKDRDAELYF